MQGVPYKIYIKLQGVVMIMVSKKCINIRPIINHYIAKSILMSGNGCNQNFYITYLLIYIKNEGEKKMGQLTP
jgi:hypothetical protein